jgi:hypothetical protein
LILNFQLIFFTIGEKVAKISATGPVILDFSSKAVICSLPWQEHYGYNLPEHITMSPAAGMSDGRYSKTMRIELFFSIGWSVH